MIDLEHARHVAMSDLLTHESTCADGCRGGRRCPEGERLFLVDAAAYHDWFQSRYPPVEVVRP